MKVCLFHKSPPWFIPQTCFQRGIDYALAESLNLELDYSDETSDFRKTTFPGRHIYERVLPDIVGRLSDIHYHRSSPYSGFGKKSSDMNYGDLHQCERLT
jgi:beta-mannosidase